MARGVDQSKAGPKSVPTPRERPQMVLGSRPQSLYAPRIKPAPANQRQYGKDSAVNTGDATGVGFSSALGGYNGRPV